MTELQKKENPLAQPEYADVEIFIRPANDTSGEHEQLLEADYEAVAEMSRDYIVDSVVRSVDVTEDERYTAGIRISGETVVESTFQTTEHPEEDLIFVINELVLDWRK